MSESDSEEESSSEDHERKEEEEEVLLNVKTGLGEIKIRRGWGREMGLRVVQLTNFNTSIEGQKAAGLSQLARVGSGDSERNLRRKWEERRKPEEEYPGCLMIEALFKCQQMRNNTSSLPVEKASLYTAIVTMLEAKELPDMQVGITQLEKHLKSKTVEVHE
ncbi:hypothetical protein L873DRAFT_1930431 [Choiromyces venosus 120613-1]|uniref:Uncharacterized protein n=1 Tax=Choiromyces venosus 120613-1 TaxID=1336337 RepID=A0A3N4JBN2_9PEZI|nr:hypothetical protein L873DRAFT_1930431 [Choiromyces venosus 120613-1]